LEVFFVHCSLFIRGHSPVKADTQLGSHATARSRKLLYPDKVALAPLWFSNCLFFSM
jgi:hypothetical protein